jgi:hypothetical protein
MSMENRLSCRETPFRLQASSAPSSPHTPFKRWHFGVSIQSLGKELCVQDTVLSGEFPQNRNIVEVAPAIEQ